MRRAIGDRLPLALADAAIDAETDRSFGTAGPGNLHGVIFVDFSVDLCGRRRLSRGGGQQRLAQVELRDRLFIRYDAFGLVADKSAIGEFAVVLDEAADPAGRRVPGDQQAVAI